MILPPSGPAACVRPLTRCRVMETLLRRKAGKVRGSLQSFFGWSGETLAGKWRKHL